MAAQDTGNGTTEKDGDPPRTTIEDHKQTYDAFLGITKWGTIAVVALLIALAVFLV